MIAEASALTVLPACTGLKPFYVIHRGKVLDIIPPAPSSIKRHLDGYDGIMDRDSRLRESLAKYILQKDLVKFTRYSVNGIAELDLSWCKPAAAFENVLMKLLSRTDRAAAEKDHRNFRFALAAVLEEHREWELKVMDDGFDMVQHKEWSQVVLGEAFNAIYRMKIAWNLSHKCPMSFRTQ